MRRTVAGMRSAGIACLGVAAVLALALAWPSSYSRIEVSLSGDQMQTGWVEAGASTGALDAFRLPDLRLSIDRPGSVLLGREEKLALVATLSSEDTGTQVYSLGAQMIAVGADVAPSGELGQGLRDGVAFQWTVLARRAPLASATLLVRLRRHSPQGATEAERLVLARDIALPVRTVAGLSAPVARLAAAILGLGGALLAIASALIRTR